MKAIRYHAFGDPSVLKLEEVPPLKAGPGQAVVWVRAAGVNPVDTYIRSGKYGPRTFPVTPGLDAAGVVEAVGAGVTEVKPGDRVYVHGSLSGTYAEQCLCDIHQVHSLPDNLTFSQGAAIGVAYATAYFALQIRTQARAGETVLVHGASGGVGTAAVQLARELGLKVLGSAGTSRGRDHVLREGAHHVLDHTSSAYLEEVMTLTKGGVNLILEMLANVNLAKDLKILAKFGRVVVIGNRGTVEIDPRDTMSRNTSILGMSIFNASQAELNTCHAEIGKGLMKGSLRPVVGKEFRLLQAADAQAAVLAPGALGKIVLTP